MVNVRPDPKQGGAVRKRPPKSGKRIKNTRRVVSTDFLCFAGDKKRASRWLKREDGTRVPVCEVCFQRVYGGGSLERTAEQLERDRGAQREVILRLLQDGIDGERARISDIARRLGVSVHTVRRRLRA